MEIDRQKLRIMHVASGDLWAGAEAQIAQLLIELGGRPDVEIAAAILNEGELAARLRAAGIETRIFDEAECSTRAIYRRTLAYMREWRPDVVHTHRHKENILGAIAARAAKIPLCVRTAHGAPENANRPWRARQAVLTAADRWTARFLQDRMIAVSDELAERLRLAYPGSDITVVPNGIDESAVRRSAFPPVALAPDRVHVAFVGRLVPVKRVDVFLAAAAHIVRSGGSDYSFHVIGDGPLRGQLEELSEKLGLGSSCVFHGFQPDAPRWIAAMHCLALTSEHEGLPIVALEALALGTPIAAHAVGGLPSLISESVGSCVFRDLDPINVAAAIRSAAARCREPRDSLLPARYTASVMGDAYLKAYRSGRPVACSKG